MSLRRDEYERNVQKPTHPANDLPQEEPRELCENEGNSRGKIEEHRSAFAQDTENDVRHNDEVQQGGTSER